MAASACNLHQLIAKVEYELVSFSLNAEQIQYFQNSIERTVSEALLKECLSSFNKLERAVVTIPTVMELRRKYQQ